MKLYRYMSLEEFSKLTSGSPLVSDAEWGKEYRSTSSGFCFLPEWAVTDWEGRCVNPVEALEFLNGIIPTACKNSFNGYYLLVEFDCHQEVVEGTGTYAVPFSWGAKYYDTMSVQEYSCREYSRITMFPIKYAIITDMASSGEYQTRWYDTNMIPDYVISTCEMHENHILAHEDGEGWYEKDAQVTIGRFRATIRPRVHH